jgi:PAS domain S-box-containing protein
MVTDFESASKEELLIELRKLQFQFDSFKATVESDIAKRHKIENSLRESEKRFRAIFEDSPLGVALVESVSGKICEVNQMFANIVGRTRNEMTSLDWISITHPDDLEVDLYKQSQLVNGIIDGFQMEKRYIRPDGSFVWINMTISRLIREDNMPMLHLCMIEDITERKKDEEEIRRQADLLNLAHDSIIVMDFYSHITYWNKGAENTYGWMREEVIGKVAHDLLETVFPCPFQSIKSDLIGKGFWEGELTHTTKKGSKIIVASRWQLQKDRNNCPVAILEINNNITEKKQIEEALYSKSSLLEAQVDSVAEGILVVDDHNMRLLINNRFIDMFNVPANVLEDQEDSKLLEYVTGLTKDPALFLEKINYLNTHTEEKSHDEIEFKNGLILDRYSAPIWGKERKSYGRIWTFHDITRLKNAKLEIKRKNAELQKVNAEKDKFYSIIAHDLRGPLGSIMTMTGMMADETEDFTDEERKEFAINLKDSAYNTYKLLEQLLDWTKMARGLTDFKPRPLLLKDVVIESLRVFDETARLKTVEMIKDIPQNLSVFADLNMLQTIIRNLVSNSLKFTPPKGKITIDANPVNNKFVEISVTDTGIGMGSEILENLFRLDVDSKRPGIDGEHSTGLGLILCQEFVERHGGEIKVESQVQKGTKFSFTMPIHEQNEAIF